MRLALLLAMGCGPRQPAAVSPVAAASPPGPVVEAEPELEPEPPAPGAEPEAPSGPRLVQSDEGWSRPGDPDGPTIALTEADHHGPRGAEAVAAVLGEVDALLVCWEAARRTQPITAIVRYRFVDDPSADLLRIDTSDDQEEFRLCVDRVVRRVVPRPEREDDLLLMLRFVAQREEIRLRQASPDAIVSVREAGTCWQWEDYPCKPNKRCKADEWVRTTCGEPAMRDDATLHVGVTPQEGWTDAHDLRLLDGDGEVLWLTPLPDDAVASLAGAVLGDGSNTVEAGRGAGMLDVYYGAKQLGLAFPSGLHVVDRKTGTLVSSWLAPPMGDLKLWFDQGRYVISGKKIQCEGDANNGAFVTLCHDRWVWFDGHTLAVIDADDGKVLGTKHLGQRGATLEAAKHMIMTAKIRTAGLQIEATGRIFVE